jgi:hypothetical protein
VLNVDGLFRGGLLPALDHSAATLESTSQRLDRQCGCMLLPRGQTTNCGYNFLSLQLQGIFGSQSFQYLRQRGTAGKCRRTTIRKKSRGFDATVANQQAQAKAIAADRVGLFGDRVCIGEFAGIARMREMIFEEF